MHSGSTHAIYSTYVYTIRDSFYTSSIAEKYARPYPVKNDSKQSYSLCRSNQTQTAFYRPGMISGRGGGEVRLLLACQCLSVDRQVCVPHLILGIGRTALAKKVFHFR